MTRYLAEILLVLHVFTHVWSEIARDHAIFKNSRRVQPLEHLSSTSTTTSTHSQQIRPGNIPNQNTYLRGRDGSKSLSTHVENGLNAKSYLTALQSFGNSFSQTLLKPSSSGNMNLIDSVLNLFLLRISISWSIQLMAYIFKFPNRSILWCSSSTSQSSRHCLLFFYLGLYYP